MKYFFSVLGILLVIAFFSKFNIWSEQQVNNVVVTVNGIDFTKEYIENVKAQKGIAEETSYVSEVVTRHLLVAEALKRQTERRPEFRDILQVLYEESLIELLLADITSNAKIEVTLEEIDTYRYSFGRTFIFFISYDTDNASEKEIRKNGAMHISLFDNLSPSLRHTLSQMRPGEVATTTIVKGRDVAVYLEKIVGKAKKEPLLDRKSIKSQLQQIKEEKYRQSWIDELRSQAKITYHKDRK